MLFRICAAIFRIVMQAVKRDGARLARKGRLGVEDIKLFFL